MKKNCMSAILFFTLCLVFTSIFCMPDTALAKGITKVSQAKKLAKKQVAGARSIKVEKDREDGTMVYQVQLVKGKKEYELVYRASDSKLLSQAWEIRSTYIKKGTGKLIGLKKCKALAKKLVSNGKIVSAVKKRSKGIDLYNIKMQKGSKKYELKYHARTGKLLEYEWELTAKANPKKEYISEEQARQAALAAAGGGTTVKIKFTTDDGIKVYEVDIVNGNYEYEVTIHAETGKVLDIDKERIASAEPQPENPTPENPSPADPVPGQDQGQAGIISEEQAREIAVKAAGGGMVVKIKLDTDDGVKVYEAEVLNGDYEFNVDILAATGEVAKVEKEFVKPGSASGDGQTQPGSSQKVSLDEAKEIALADAGAASADISYTKAELELEDGIWVYEIKFHTAAYQYEYEINAANGEICHKEQKKRTDAGENGSGNAGNTGGSRDYIGAEQAKSIAASHAGFSVSDVRFQKTELDREDGEMVYEVEFKKDGMEYEYEINAVTGEIIKSEQEWDD